MLNTLSTKRGHMLILQDTTQFLRNDVYILKHLVEACRVRLENPGQIKIAASIAYFVILILGLNLAFLYSIGRFVKIG